MIEDRKGKKAKAIEAIQKMEFVPSERGTQNAIGHLEPARPDRFSGDTISMSEASLPKREEPIGMRIPTINVRDD